MTNYERYQECTAELAALLKEHSTEMIQEMAQKMFDAVPNMNGFVYYVWTPSWNDGEECRQDYDTTFDFEDHIDTEVEYNDITEEDEKLAFDLFDNTIFDKLYEDNFKVVILREEDGTISVTNEDYDCGY